MDTSETYIKMRKKSIFDIESKQPNGLNLHHYYGDIFVDYQGTFFVKWLAGWVDLPRQDQLQEMISKGLASWESYAFGFGDWCLKHYKDYGQLGSMEQLWLAFVMKEKYNKIWDGEEWQEIK